MHHQPHPILCKFTLKFSVKSIVPLFFFFSPLRSRWGPVPVLHASAAWLWHHGEAHQAAGQLLPGGDPQDGCLPLRGGHQA